MSNDNEITISPQAIADQKSEQYGYIGLHLGCGKNFHPDFVNCDLQGGECVLDVAEPFDIKSNCVDFIYSEHMIEHLKFNQTEVFLKESFRVLKKGGRKRILFPDLKKLITLALEDAPVMAELRERCVNGVKNTNGSYVIHPKASKFQGENWDNLDDVVHNFTSFWGHQYMWSAPHLIKVLKSIGFSKVEELPYGTGDCSTIIKDPDVRWGQAWTSVIEVIK